MIRITCPSCGPRDHAEFSYIGDATKARPGDDATPEVWFDFVYIRDNPRGPHQEYWQHIHGCRRFVKLVRDTLTHQTFVSGTPGDDLSAHLPDARSDASPDIGPDIKTGDQS